MRLRACRPLRRTLGVEMSYWVELDHFLSDDELENLRADHLPRLIALNGKYTKHIDPVAQFPVTPIYVDYLRYSWMTDSSGDRLSQEEAVKGLGFAFGLLLASCTELRWAIARDADGQFLTLARRAKDPQLVSVPPFNYVEKRVEVENAEVFHHFFEQAEASLIGFRKPKYWLLDGDA
jgi:hypothetical protein